MYEMNSQNARMYLDLLADSEPEWVDFIFTVFSKFSIFILRIVTSQQDYLKFIIGKLLTHMRIPKYDFNLESVHFTDSEIKHIMGILENRAANPRAELDITKARIGNLLVKFQSNSVLTIYRFVSFLVNKVINPLAICRGLMTIKTEDALNFTHQPVAKVKGGGGRKILSKQVFLFFPEKLKLMIVKNDHFTRAHAFQLDFDKI
jgi:hypothetical protein